jgi:hypothetical protein
MGKKESQDNHERKTSSGRMVKLDYWWPSQIETQKGKRNKCTRKIKQRDEHQTKIKEGKVGKGAETSKGGSEQQTRLRSVWTLLHEFFRRLPDRLLRESE